MYKKDYAYKELKQPKAFLRHIKGMNLVSMTVSLADLHHQGNIQATYLTTQAKYDKEDFKTLSFSLFSTQHELINYLHENASGLFKETAPLTFLVQEESPSFLFREFKLDGTKYVLAHVKDAGLMYHILFGNKGFKMPIGMKDQVFTSQVDIYHILELANYGLLGRNIKIEQMNKLAFSYEYSLEQTFLTYGQRPIKGKRAKQFQIRFMNQSAKLLYEPNKTWKAVKITADKESLNQFAKGENLPKFKLELYSRKQTSYNRRLALDYQWLA